MRVLIFEHEYFCRTCAASVKIYARYRFAQIHSLNVCFHIKVFQRNAAELFIFSVFEQARARVVQICSVSKCELRKCNFFVYRNVLIVYRYRNLHRGEPLARNYQNMFSNRQGNGKLSVTRRADDAALLVFYRYGISRRIKTAFITVTARNRICSFLRRYFYRSAFRYRNSIFVRRACRDFFSVIGNFYDMTFFCPADRQRHILSFQNALLAQLRRNSFGFTINRQLRITCIIYCRLIGFTVTYIFYGETVRPHSVCKNPESFFLFGVPYRRRVEIRIVYRRPICRIAYDFRPIIVDTYINCLTIYHDGQPACRFIRYGRFIIAVAAIVPARSPCDPDLKHMRVLIFEHEHLCRTCAASVKIYARY